MNRQGYNDFSISQHEANTTVDNNYIPEDAQPLCPNCLKPCHPLQYYCDKCGSNDAINPLTPYIGFVNIRFNYGIFITMWRKIWYEEDTSIITKLFYLYMITMFVPLFLVVGLPLFLICEIPRNRIRSTVIILFVIAILLLIFFAHYRLFTGLLSHPISVTIR